MQTGLPMPTNKLFDAQCKAIKPGEKLTTKTYDGGGLHLAVTPLGAKGGSWRTGWSASRRRSAWAPAPRSRLPMLD